MPDRAAARTLLFSQKNVNTKQKTDRETHLSVYFLFPCTVRSAPWVTLCTYKHEPLRLQGFTWRGRRDLNPRAGFIQPTPLAGEPLRPLGYFRRSMVFYEIGGESGIRTHGCFHIAGFQDRCFQPLSHLSMLVRSRLTLKRK